MIKIYPFRYHLLFISFILMILIFKGSYLSYPFVWDELQLTKRNVLEGNFTFFIPFFSDPFATYGHPPGVAFLQALWSKLFGGTIESLRLSSLFASATMLCSLVFLGEKIKDFSLGIVVALIFFMSNVYFPLLISFLPPSYEIASASALLAISLDKKRRPMLFCFLGILAFCMREPNLAFWLPYTLVWSAHWIKEKSFKDFPWESLIVLIFAGSHFLSNYLKTGYWIAHPTIISGNALALLSVGTMLKLFGQLLWKNLGIIGLSSLFLSLFTLYQKKKLQKVLKGCWKIWCPLILLLSFYLFLYRDFAHRDFASSFALLYLLLVYFFSEAFFKVKKFTLLAPLATLALVIELFFTESYHGSLLEKQYFQKNTELYQEAIEDLKDFNLRGHYVYAPWPLSHMLYKPWLGWTERLHVYIAPQPQKATIALISNATSGPQSLNAQKWEKFHEISHEDLSVEFYKRR